MLISCHIFSITILLTNVTRINVINDMLRDSKALMVCFSPSNPYVCFENGAQVLTLLINAAYKPSRVLRELQLDKDSVWHGCGEVLKAK